jgi:putative ABC transport system substrate-binding protein
MDRRTFVGTTIGSAVIRAFPANAQPVTKVPRIGVLFPGTRAIAAKFVEAFGNGLREHEYVEGRNIVVERRYGDATLERIVEVAGELIRLKLELIVTATNVAIAAIQRQSPTIAIVMANSTDPVGTGFVASLAHPGGNITGITSFSSELNAKRLEFLKEAIPGLAKVAIMWNPDDRGGVTDFTETESAGRALRLQLQSLEVSRADGLERAFSVLTADRADAVIVIPSAFTYTNRDQIASLALRIACRPCTGRRRTSPRAASSPMARAMARPGGAPPTSWTGSSGRQAGDLPIEQPRDFELVLNVTTAKVLGLTFSPSLLARANDVVS